MTPKDHTHENRIFQVWKIYTKICELSKTTNDLDLLEKILRKWVTLNIPYGIVTRRDYLQQALTIFLTHGKKFSTSNWCDGLNFKQKLENPEELV